MNILFLTPGLPYPPCDGDKLRSFNLLKRLSKKNKIFLVSMIKPGEERFKKDLEKYCAAVVLVPVTKNQIFFRALNGLFSNLALNISAYADKRVESEIKTLLAREKINVVFVYRLRMAQYAQSLEIPKVVDMVDSLALYMDRVKKSGAGIFYKMYATIDGARLKKYEKNVAGVFDKVFINSEEDAKYIGAKNIVTAANGVASPASGNIKKDKTVFTAGYFGNMNYPPNADGLKFLLEKVRKITTVQDKNIKFVIVGEGSEKACTKYKGEDFEVSGFVENIDALIRSWDCVVAPVRYGAGRQNKVMQAWANKVPVVAHPFAASGVYGVNGVNILTATTEKEFAQKLMELKNNPRLGKKIAAAAKVMQTKCFNWDKTALLVEKELKKIIRRNKK